MTIAQSAVLTACSIDLGSAAQDKLSIAGTLILTGTEIYAASITGQSEIAAVRAIYADLDVDFANILDLGETAENFRGSGEGCKSDGDSIDHIRFKADAEDILNVTGVDIDSWTLLDKKGNEINDDSITNRISTSHSPGFFIVLNPLPFENLRICQDLRVLQNFQKRIDR